MRLMSFVFDRFQQLKNHLKNLKNMNKKFYMVTAATAA